MDRQTILDYLSGKINQKRFTHTINTEKAALMLADLYHVDRDKASTAALLHDAAKQMSPDELLQAAREFGIDLTGGYEEAPKLLHGPVAAAMVKRDLGIEDEDILNAISTHTLGGENMTKLQKVVFLADYIEEDRAFAEVRELRRMVKQDMDRAMLFAMNKTIELLIRRDQYIHLQTIRTRNSLLAKLPGMGKGRY